MKQGVTALMLTDKARLVQEALDFGSASSKA